LRRWLVGAIGLGVFMAFMVALVTLSPPTKAEVVKEWAVTKPIMTVLAPCLIVAGIVGLFFLRPRTRRERDVRRLLGLHALGSSDPLSWVEEDLTPFRRGEALFGTATYAEAVPKLLDAGAWSGAMWAARLTAALENERTGEDLTDEVLGHPGTREALSRFQRDAKGWAEAMGAAVLERYRSSNVRTPAPEASLDQPEA
jgi:hypothetical protein